MKIGSLLFLTICACLWMLQASAHAGAAKPHPIVMDGGRMGKVLVTLPKGKANDVIILFVDDPSASVAASAVMRLTALGSAVAVVNTRSYLGALIADTGECVWLSSEVEELNHAIQRKLSFPDFRLPILTSIGQGGVLVYTLLAEAPSYSFAGGVSIDFAPADKDRLNFCGIGKGDGSKQWLPPVNVNLPWRIEPNAEMQDDVSDWVSNVDKAELVQAGDKDIANRVATFTKPLLDGVIQKDPNSLEDLPLIEIPGSNHAPYIAIIWSGDGGWRDLDRTLGQKLADKGVPVVGVDSLLYFWQPKRPEIVAHDIDRIVEHYHEQWKVDHFVLIGYSFGADILPFAYNRMTPEDKALVGQLSLLALSRNTRFEISVSEFFVDNATSETRLVGPELTKINPALVQCFYGEDEADDSGCTTSDAKKDELIKTPGGHHFGDDYDMLAKRIMVGASKRLKS
jgi:type IV secretory pathway VirJ component